MVSSLVRVIFLEVGNSQDGLQKLSIVHAIENVQRVLEWNGHSVDLVHAVGTGGGLVSRVRNAHHLHEVDEALEGDHGVFFLLELLLLEGGVEFEVID